MSLETLLLLVAGLQLAIAILNLFLVPLLKWQADLARAPLLLREVFQVHAWFISVTLTIFALLTLRFSHEMATGSNIVATWLAGAIGTFWAIRTILQIVYYSSTHWRGQAVRTAIHISLLFLYGGFAAAYISAAWSLK
jgi:hypothetical protein